MLGQQPRVKTLLYVYRTLLTGLQLMRTGEVQASLPALLHHVPLGGVDELMARKTSGAEKQLLSAVEVDRHAKVYERLVLELEQAREKSGLPERSDAFDAVDELVRGERLQQR